MNKARVLYGHHLIKYADQIDFAKGLAKLIDPDGINVIAMEMPHRDFEEMRLVMLFKLKGKDEPTEGDMTMPFDLFSTLVDTIEVKVRSRAN